MISHERLHMTVWLTKLLCPPSAKPYMAERRPAFTRLCTEWDSALHKNSGICLACSPMLFQTPCWFPRYLCVSCSALAVTLTASAFHLSFPRNSAEDDSYVFPSQNKTVACLLAGLVGKELVHSKRFNAAQSEPKWEEHYMCTQSIFSTNTTEIPTSQPPLACVHEWNAAQYWEYFFFHQ